MIALVKVDEGKGNVQLMEVPEPVVKPGEIKIRVAAVGICGTDIKIYHGDTWCNPPVILGHEFSGVVEETGEGVTKVKVGDRVISETAQKICGHCYYCNTSNQLMCPQRLSIGYGTDGAMAAYCVVREGIIHKLPDSISLDEAAVCEPTTVALHAVYDAVKLCPADHVVVMGPGPIGLLVAQAVKGFGCTTILIGTDKDKERLRLGLELNIDYVFDATKTDMVGEINQLTCGMGADVVFDCTGAAPAIRAGMSALKKTGKLVQVGLTSQNMEVEYGLLTQKEISIIGTFGHNWKCWEMAIHLIKEKKINVSALITHHFKLEEWEKAFEIAEKQEGIKVLIHP